MMDTEIIPFEPFEAEKIGFKVSKMKMGLFGYLNFQSKEGHFKPNFLCEFLR